MYDFGKAVEQTIKGIKCDDPGCNYSDMTVSSDDYLDWLNKPCPNCGANLLTQADYDLVQVITGITDTINEICGDVDYSDEDRDTFSIEMNGSGIPKIKEIEDEG